MKHKKNMGFTVLHIAIRNDGCPPHKRVTYETYETYEEAVQQALSYFEDLDLDLHSQARTVLERSRPIWIWEWKRKGNGDYIEIIPDYVDVAEYVLNIDYDNSETIE